MTLPRAYVAAVGAAVAAGGSDLIAVLVERAGGGPAVKRGESLYACCPWHQESDPSCQITASHAHCLACRANGDALDLMTAAMRARRGAEAVMVALGNRLGDYAAVRRQIPRRSPYITVVIRSRDA